MKILIGCEESDQVRGRFEKLGFDVWSCDIQPNRNPNAKHFQTDIFEILDLGWDVLIAFPPCTDLAVSGASWFKEKIASGQQQKSIEFFLKLANANIKHIAIENPVGIMSSKYRKPDQIIHPYFFGDKVSKKTCLWLKNLPPLLHFESDNLFCSMTHSEPDWKIYNGKRYSGPAAKRYQSKEIRSKERSKTYDGIADAMATQWGEYLKYKARQ